MNFESDSIEHKVMTTDSDQVCVTELTSEFSSYVFGYQYSHITKYQSLHIIEYQCSYVMEYQSLSVMKYQCLNVTRYQLHFHNK